MSKTLTSGDFLSASRVDAEVFGLRPDYRAKLIVVEGLVPVAETDDQHRFVDELVSAAETHARQLVRESPVDRLPHIAAWREAYRAFGAKPQRTRNSLEALVRRAEKGLPRVNALTDIYNAVSVLHQSPLGGEDFHAYEGSAKLVRATGAEPFDTVASGEAVIEHPEPGEVVWSDDAGVTCRRWNWRQCRRTGLTDETTAALFIIDALDPMSDAELEATADALVGHLRRLSPEVSVHSTLVRRK